MLLHGAVTDRGDVAEGTIGSGGSAEEAEPLVAALKPAQRSVLADLAARGVDELTRAEYERIGLVSRSQAAYDLAELVQMGLLERIGSGRATQYRRAHPGPGRKRRWTNDRIRAELEAFCAGRPDWPRAHDFRTAGRGDLYLAASRYGGIDHWAAELGYGTARGHAESRETRETRVVPSPPRRRSGRAIGRLAVLAVRPAVLAGAVLGLGLAGALAIASEYPAWNASRGTPAPVEPEAALRPDPARNQAAPTVSAVSSRAERDGAVLLLLHAARGSSWVTVRRGSARGSIAFSGMLARGATARVSGTRLWIRLDAAWNVDARVDGRTVDVRAARVGIVTSRGVVIVARAHRPRPAAPPPPPPPAPVVVALAISSRSEATPPPPSPPPPPPAASQPVAATPQTPAPDPQPASGPGPDPEPRP